jgi:hypothetical protein
MRGGNIPSFVPLNFTVCKYHIAQDLNLVNRAGEPMHQINVTSDESTTTALSKLCSRSFYTKIHLKKNLKVEKLDGNQVVIKFPIDYRRVFSITFCFRAGFLKTNPEY